MRGQQDSRELRKAELLGQFIVQLRQVEDADDMTIVAILGPEFVELIGIMEVAAQVYALTQEETGGERRLETARRRLTAALRQSKSTAARQGPPDG